MFVFHVLGGGSIMTWGGFGYNGTTSLATVDHRMNSEIYQDTLKNHLLPHSQRIAGRGYIFQQDNATCHVSNSTRNWFEKKGVRTLDWPARSPDLNPMENLWGIMVHQVYGHGKQYANKEELEVAIRRAWDTLPIQTLRDLNNSMRDRIFQCVLNHGGFVK